MLLVQPAVIKVAQRSAACQIISQENDTVHQATFRVWDTWRPFRSTVFRSVSCQYRQNDSSRNLLSSCSVSPSASSQCAGEGDLSAIRRGARHRCTSI